MPRIRTNIELESDDLDVIMDRYGLRTKTDAVALALRHLAGQPETRDVPADVPPAGATR